MEARCRHRPEAAKQRLKDDAALLARGALDSVPMDTSSADRWHRKVVSRHVCRGRDRNSCVSLKNFRSKYVGESEGNPSACCPCFAPWDRCWSWSTRPTRRSGDRETEGDSGTSSRVFGMIETRWAIRDIAAAFSGCCDGSSRPLPIDIKSAGARRSPYPLFYLLREVRCGRVRHAGEEAGHTAPGGRATDSIQGAVERG